MCNFSFLLLKRLPAAWQERRGEPVGSFGSKVIFFEDYALTIDLFSLHSGGDGDWLSLFVGWNGHAYIHTSRREDDRIRGPCRVYHMLFPKRLLYFLTRDHMKQADITAHSINYPQTMATLLLQKNKVFCSKHSNTSQNS